jgi:hypothetical protein
MRVDPIIEELHAVRQQLMREAGGDLAVAIERASEAGKRYRATHPCKVIKGVPRRPLGWVPAGGERK